MKHILALVVGFMPLATPAFCWRRRRQVDRQPRHADRQRPSRLHVQGRWRHPDGTSLGPDGGEIAITDGKIDGN
jgi:hypothetical protein